MFVARTRKLAEWESKRKLGTQRKHTLGRSNGFAGHHRRRHQVRTRARPGSGFSRKSDNPKINSIIMNIIFFIIILFDRKNMLISCCCAEICGNFWFIQGRTLLKKYIFEPKLLIIGKSWESLWFFIINFEVFSWIK